MIDQLPMTVPLSRRAMLKTALVASAAAAVPALGQAAGATAARTQATPGVQGDPEELFEALDALVASRMAELQVPGVAIGVILGDREHAAGFGVTNIDHPLPVDTQTLFQIGSTTKTFTATALMRLVEEGQIDLEAPVRTYLPEFRVADETVSQQVRVQDLLTHSSGWFGDDFTDPGNGDDALATYVAGLAALPQISPLGEHFSYNNAAFSLAGRIIEVVTGQTFESAMADLIFAPLGLEESFFFPEEIMTRAFAVGHTARPDDPEGPPAVVETWAVPRAAAPAGGIISTVTDQLRYARFHLGDGTVDGQRVLSAASLAEMQRPHAPGGALGPRVLDSVGLSWMLTTLGGERVVMHGGSTFGQQSTFLLVPERRFAITLLTNADAGSALGEEVAALALEHALGLRLPVPTPIEVAPETLADYVGDYSFGEGPEVSITLDEGELMLAANASGTPLPGGSGSLRFVGPDRGAFDYMGSIMLIDFVRDDTGTVAWLRFSGRLMPRQS